MSAFSEFTKTVLWLRKNRVSWNQLTVGNITIDGTDLRPDGAAKDSSTPEAPRQTITEKYGVAYLTASAEPEDTMSPVVEQDDDD